MVFHLVCIALDDDVMLISPSGDHSLSTSGICSNIPQEYGGVDDCLQSSLIPDSESCSHVSHVYVICT